MIKTKPRPTAGFSKHCARVNGSSSCHCQMSTVARADSLARIRVGTNPGDQRREYMIRHIGDESDIIIVQYSELSDQIGRCDKKKWRRAWDP